MTIATNTFLSFSAIGNREDLADVIYDISPTDTPFMGSIGTTKATNRLHEWQTDSLAAAAANAQLEGDEFSANAVTVTSRVNNRTQISSKPIIVSETQNAIDTAGRSKEMVYQLTKAAKELKRDMEFVLTNNQAPVTGDSTTAPQLRPLCGWYATNDSRDATGADGTTSAAATDGTKRAFTQSLLEGVIQSVWTAGGEADMILVGPHNKKTLSGFGTGLTKDVNMSTGTLYTAIDIYASDFGKHKVVAGRFNRDRDAHVLSTDYWAVAYLRPMKTRDFAQTGDATKGDVIAEYTLEAKNEAASGIVADLTTS